MMNNSDMPATSIQFEGYDDKGRLCELTQLKGLTKREHCAIELFKAIVIANNGDMSALGKGAALDAIKSANILLAALEAEQ